MLQTSEAVYAGGRQRVQLAAGAKKDSLEESGGEKTLAPQGELPKSSGFAFTRPSGEEPTERVWEAEASVSGGATAVNVSLRDLD